VHVGAKVHNTVAFLGWADKSAPGGLRCEGTGFFVAHGDAGYLVTARHVAENLDGGPFAVRVNRKGGDAELLDVDVGWTYHPDSLVDIAAIPLHLGIRDGYMAEYIRTETMATPDFLEAAEINVGDLCYTVGLFRFIFGTKTNLPLVHSGNIALMPPAGERIPVWNDKKKQTELVEGYLVEGRAINGASGSPVFVRWSFRYDGMINIKDPTDGNKIYPMLAEGRVRLLGLLQGAWFLPPDAILAMGHRTKPADVVPVGIGVVVPATKIIELLEEHPNLKKERAINQAQSAARPVSVSSEDEAPQSNDTNPAHREDFTALLNTAARKQKPDGT
jgi:hypothetical protein